MNGFWSHIPDVIALIIVTGCIIMLCLGIDGEVKGILGVAAGFIFGRYEPYVASKITSRSTT